MVSSLDVVLDDIQSSLSAGNYQQALKQYLALYKQQPAYLDATQGKLDPVRRTHISNAANLARRDGYLHLQFMEQASGRFKKALEHFFGVAKHAFKYPLQRPNFFYIPDLPSQPFYEESEITSLGKWLDDLEPLKGELLEAGYSASDRYIDDFEHVPDTVSWKALRDRWRSLHLLKGGALTSEGETLSDALKALFKGEPLAYCPPHAPEVFLSVLKPGAEIPPHYGISNCKLTVHVPLQVNSNSLLNAGEERFTWGKDQRVMVFDDSFLHSAANQSDEVRMVLIADVWNPYLTHEERQATASFMAIFDEWQRGAGQLADLDRALR